MPEIHERLLADPPARVADLACGQGRSSIEMARAYPKVRVDGIDSDHASIERAREHLEGSGVEDRVTFHERDAADAELAGSYDLVTIFEALHDMSYPVDVLRAARGLLGEGGVMFIGDERTDEAFTAPAGDVERLYYGFSVFHCLPVGMVGDGRRRHGHRHPRRDGSTVRRRGRLLELRGRADRERLLALLPAEALETIVAYHWPMLPGGVLLQPLTPSEDDRGAFTELFRNSWSLEVKPAQWNAVRSVPTVLRGVHAHWRHADYLTLVAGRATIGLHDLREGSPTEGLGATVEMCGDEPAALVVPPGVAHGFYFHEPSIHVYAVDHEWDPADELGCRWDEPDLEIEWPCTQPMLSPRDDALGSLSGLRAAVRQRLVPA